VPPVKVLVHMTPVGKLGGITSGDDEVVFLLNSLAMTIETRKRKS
jgi:hypothetical protein